MPKMKSHRGAAKRFKVLGSGKFKRRKANRAHINSHMSTKRKRNLRSQGHVHAADEKQIKRLLPYAVK
ncbi:MAG: 50S ribosomal protein L35 [Myxococcota bacterium]|nr:50S ribosomal protein L35 [Myxococcota bacterium]